MAKCVEVFLSQRLFVRKPKTAVTLQGPQLLSALAKLDVELAAGLGAGVTGNLMLRVDNGRFLLLIKASLIWGAGLKGYMTFEVGYESVVALTELVRQKMAANRYKDLNWVDGEAMAYVRDLSLLGATPPHKHVSHMQTHALQHK